MAFSDFINKAWNDHASDADGVARRLFEGVALADRPEHIPQLAQIITHVFGEHLGRWDEGISQLHEIKKAKGYSGNEAEQSVQRSIATLEISSGKRSAIEEFGLSDQIRILATASSTLVGQNSIANAQRYFEQALHIAQSGLAKDDPANRALAVTGNNLASSLEEKTERTEAECKLMILAAQAARKYWEIAGNWLHVERAEYRLANTFIKAGEPELALIHASNCLEISKSNNAPALELFFACEALVLGFRALGKSDEAKGKLLEMKNHFDSLSEEDKKWCAAILEKLIG